MAADRPVVLTNCAYATCAGCARLSGAHTMGVDWGSTMRVLILAGVLFALGCDDGASETSATDGPQGVSLDELQAIWGLDDCPSQLDKREGVCVPSEAMMQDVRDCQVVAPCLHARPFSEWAVGPLPDGTIPDSWDDMPSCSRAAVFGVLDSGAAELMRGVGVSESDPYGVWWSGAVGAERLIYVDYAGWGNLGEGPREGIGWPLLGLDESTVEAAAECVDSVADEIVSRRWRDVDAF